MKTTSSPEPADVPEALGQASAPEPVYPPVTAGSAAPSPADPSLDLAAGAPPLRPVFPLEEEDTGLVLYAGPPGEMRIHWRLDPDDFERAAASFPSSGGRPATVLRLRRDRPQGGADQADEIRLGLEVREGSGERAVRIPTDHCRYHAELGLANAAGGWLMLARSNRLYNAIGIGLDLNGLPARKAGGGLQRDPSQGAVLGAVAPSSIRAGSQVLQTELPVEPALTEGFLVDQDFPMIQWERSLATASSDPDHAAEREAGPLSEAGGGGIGLTQGPRVEVRGGAIPLEGPGSRPPTPSGRALVGTDGQAPGPVLYQGPSGPLAARPTPTGVAMEPLSYESPPQQASRLEVEAELRIFGRAPPGATVDLFGFPYRVGAGGRFQLALPVKDPELLHRALAAAPPAELTQGRDD